MTALGFYDRWEEGSTTTLMIPASCLVEFLDQFKRMGYSQSYGNPPWTPDELLKDPGLQEQSLCFHTTHLRDYNFGDDLSLHIERIADGDYECVIRSHWD